MPTPRNARAERKAADESNAIAFFGSRTEVGHIREHNEDSLVAVPPLFAVADGMGGHEAGEVASEIAINTIMELAPDHADSDALARDCRKPQRYQSTRKRHWPRRHGHHAYRRHPGR